MTATRKRRIAYAAGALLLLLVALAAVLLATFDAERQKALAAEWMRTEHQRTLAIDGPVRLSIFPRLAVQVAGLRLSERGGDDEFLSAQAAALAVQLWPLLRGRLVIDRISARGVRASVLRDGQGVRNVDSLLSAEDPARADAASGEAPLGLDIRALRIDDLRLRLRDETLGVAGEIAVQSLSTGRLGHLAEAPLSLRATVQLVQPEPLTLALDGRMTLAFDLQERKVAVTDLTLDVRGDAAGVTDLSLVLEGAARWAGGALHAGPLRAALKSATVGGTALGPSTLAVERAVFRPDGQRLDVGALALALAGRQGGQPFEFALDWPQLVIDARTVSGSALSGRFQRGGPLAVAVAGRFSSAAPGGSMDALQLPALAVTLQGQAGPRKIDGSAEADAVLSVGRGAAALERLALRATLADPGRPPLQLELNGSASADAQAARWALNGRLDGGRFESSGQLSFAGAVPAVRADARFDSLDLNRLLAADPPAAAAAAASTPADPPVDLQGLGAFDGRFTLAAGSLAFRRYRVAAVELKAVLDNGLLRVERLAGNAWGGRVEGRGSADSRSGRLALELTAQGVDVDALLQDVAGKSPLEGTGRIVADLETGGASIGALRRNLAGTLSVRVRDGALEGIDLTRALQQAKAAGLPQDRISKASAIEKTPFEVLSASARVAGGVAHSDDLDLRSPLFHVGGAGRLDIGHGRVDYTARVSVVAAPTARRESAEWLTALRGVTVPVQVSGPLDAIEWKVRWSGVAATAAGSTLRELIRRELGAAQDKAPAPAGAASAPAAPLDTLRRKLEGLLK
jgi:AsmA protein